MSTSRRFHQSSHSISSSSNDFQPNDLQDMMNSQMPQDPSGHQYQHADIPMDAPEDNNASKTDGAKSEGKSKDKRERLSRACIACHTGKTRCSNTLPCESCIKRGIGATCSYPDPQDPSTSEPPAPRRRSNNPNQQQQQQQQPPQPQQQQQPPPAQAQQVPAQPQPAQAASISAQASQMFTQNPHVRGLYYDANIPTGSGPAFTANGTLMTPIAAGTAGAIAAIRKDASPVAGRPSKKARYRNLTEQEIATFTPKPYKRGTFFVGDSAPVAIDPRLPLRLMLADEERVDFFVGDLPP